MDWFVAVADGPAEEQAVRTFRSRAAQRLDHPSGRPWLVGTWTGDQLVHVAGRDCQVAVLGATAVTTARLARVRAPADLDVLARELTGDWHLIATFGGLLHVRGMASGLRRVHYALVDGVPVAADRADLLADGRALDLGALAVRLLTTDAGPLADVSGWHGVRRVPAGSYLTTRPGGGAEEVRWWAPPAAVLGVEEGAPMVREALRNAVSARMAGSVSADLSGGMDSTSLCFLIDECLPGKFVTQVMNAPDVDFDDVEWAAEAAARLSSTHQVVDFAGVPEWFGGMDVLRPDPEQPYGEIRSLRRTEDQAARMAAAGSRVHFTGVGGDELFRPTPHYLHALVRTNPARAYRVLNRHRRQHRWPLAQLTRSLTDRRSYRQTLRDVVTRVRTPESAEDALDLSWIAPLRLPPWATPLAAELATTQLLEADAAPLGPDRATHAAVEAVRVGAEFARISGRVMRRHGVRAATPFFDDRVVEAALSVRPSDHGGPDRYKPLLAAAMRGVVPDHLLARRTKGEFSSELYRGLRLNRATLVRVFEDSELARLGLVDPAAVHDVLVGVHRDNLGLIALETTLACEVWLRDLATRTARVGR